MHLIYESASGRFRIFGARHFGRRVILKCAGSKFIDDPLVNAQLHKEFSIGFGIDHPGVCRSFGLITVLDGIPALEMEYCPGVTLRELIDSESEKLSGPEAINVVCGLLEALEAVHRAGVVHRDIKPANIMIDTLTGNVKIIDFGCADAPEQLLLKEPAGTPRYQRPEYTGERPSPADDLYALGLTLAEMAGEVDDAAVSTRISALARELTKGRFGTSREALSWFQNRGRAKGMRRAAIIIPVLIVAASAAWWMSSHGHRTEIIEDGVVLDTTANIVAEERMIDEAEDTVDLDRRARFAGDLLYRYSIGDVSEDEAADAIAIRTADSVYVNEVEPIFSGRRLLPEEIDSVTSRYMDSYSGLLENKYSENGWERYYSSRARRLFYFRIRFNLLTYHGS
ncbi:MAG: serine/threonine protein kinase [Muribaculaceae bacterium]|nr:serine/threonine protein kinase [Muribaculaceae bacterium]